MNFTRRTFLAAASSAPMLVAAPSALKPIRLGGPIFLKSDDPHELAREHRRLGYAAAYCPPATADNRERNSRRPATRLLPKTLSSLKSERGKTFWIPTPRSGPKIYAMSSTVCVWPKPSEHAAASTSQAPLIPTSGTVRIPKIFRGSFSMQPWRIAARSSMTLNRETQSFRLR